MAKALNLGVTAWAPLEKGVLTGKYHGDSNGAQGRMSAPDMQEFLPEQQRTQRIIAALKAVAEQTGRSMAQVALAWLRHRPVPAIPILGARKVPQLKDNLASLDLNLSADQVQALDDAGRIEIGFPYHLYEKELTRGLAFGGMRDLIVA